MIWNSTNETSFPYTLLLTATQVSRICKAFANSLSANIKFSKTQLSKMVQLEGLFGDLFYATPAVLFVIGAKALERGVKKGEILAKKAAPALAEKATEYYVNKRINEVNKKFTPRKGSGIMLKNNEINDFVQVNRSLENRGLLLKGTAKRLLVKKEDFSIFLYH